MRGSISEPFPASGASRAFRSGESVPSGSKRRFRSPQAWLSYDGGGASRASCRCAQVVGGEREQGSGGDALLTDEAGPAHAADGLDPAERFLDLLALAQTDRVAGTGCGTSVDRAATVGRVLGNMRGDPVRA